MRVLHLLPSVGQGGAEAVAETLRALGEARAVPSEIHGRLDHAQRAPWTAWARWALTAPRGDCVVHAHLPWPDRLGPALLAARGRPMVVTFHLLPEGEDWPRDRLSRLDARTMLRACAGRGRTCWVALSSADAARLRALGLRVEVVRNAPPAPRAAATEIPVANGTLRLVSVGRLDPQKGFDQMLPALAALRALRWHWLVAGEGPARDALTSQRDALDLATRVTLLGARPAREVLAGAALLLAPSRAEGMPLVPMEAIEAGVPVIASPIAAHAELFAATPECLLPADARAWPDALARWIHDDDARRALHVAQRAVLGDDPRARLWRDYEALYRAAAETP
jgi:glycosyltransferase involved in cell wall biosynthesis